MVSTPLIDKQVQYHPPGRLYRAPGRQKTMLKSACIALFNACELEQYGEATARGDKLLGEWNQPDFDMTTSTWVIFSPKNQLAGYAEVWDTGEIPVQPSVWGRVHPQHRGKGIGAYLMATGITRARHAIDRCPPDARVAVQSWCQMGHQPSERLFEKSGMETVRHFWTMRIDDLDAVPKPKIPEGIEFRAMQYPEEFEKVVAATNDAFRDHWGHVEQPHEKEVQEWQDWVTHDPDFEANYWFLAIDSASGDIAGMSLCSKISRNNPEIGLVDTLGVRRAWRRKGLALALLHHSFRQLRAAGNKSVILGVDASSLTGATRLYERAGMAVERQNSVYEMELRPGKSLVTTDLKD